MFANVFVVARHIRIDYFIKIHDTVLLFLNICCVFFLVVVAPFYFPLSFFSLSYLSFIIAFDSLFLMYVLRFFFFYCDLCVNCVYFAFR